ncbi:hypothetical protein MLD38_010315 [Melastoma candidum]|uniref:Uncharacterized protein n=1 Tax=Melastoma candidum TaxID=119954 RepID=A0ACB9QZF5_9MYRT|nr:hypothetical protein MLD38_010315 [Melastoma candidum]
MEGGPLVQAAFQLGSEDYSVVADLGTLSEQLVSIKEKSMSILKDYITRHNVPIDVPDDELVESSSEDGGEAVENPVTSKKTKIN